MNIFRKISKSCRFYGASGLLKFSAGFLAACCLLGGVSANVVVAGTCGSFYLRNISGEIINPLTGKNADQPFSTRQTCGVCHDYDTITKGFHFQQGWEKISDSYNAKMPWVLSDGMMGKH